MVEVFGKQFDTAVEAARCARDWQQKNNLPVDELKKVMVLHNGCKSKEKPHYKVYFFCAYNFSNEKWNIDTAWNILYLHRSSIEEEMHSVADANKNYVVCIIHQSDDESHFVEIYNELEYKEV